LVNDRIGSRAGNRLSNCDGVQAIEHGWFRTEIA
jgi:hypothetical protein